MKLPAVSRIHTWLAERELDDGDFLHLRRVILAGGRSKSWINGRPASLSDLRALGTQLVDLHSQHTQQQLLSAAYARDWLDHAAGLSEPASLLRRLYRQWQSHLSQQQQALAAQASRVERLRLLHDQLEELEPLLGLDYRTIEQEHDRLSHFEQMMQDCAVLLEGLDGESGGLAGALAGLLRKCQRGSSTGGCPIIQVLDSD